MLRALAVFVFLLLAAGLYALVAGGPAHAAAPETPQGSDFGFALAAGSIALMATLLIAKPRWRFRR